MIIKGGGDRYSALCELTLEVDGPLIKVSADGALWLTPGQLTHLRDQLGELIEAAEINEIETISNPD